MLWHAQRTLAGHVVLAHGRVEEALRGPHQPELLSQAEARARALEMVERLQRLYTTTLKALQAQRRVPGVVVRRAGQVNVAGQQVNMHG